jgi:hypothetical protein
MLARRTPLLMRRSALYVLKQQHLYFEIEGEANLVLDQLKFLISDELYSHCKDLASTAGMDKDYKNRLSLIAQSKVRPFSLSWGEG